MEAERTRSHPPPFSLRVNTDSSSRLGVNPLWVEMRTVALAGNHVRLDALLTAGLRTTTETVRQALRTIYFVELLAASILGAMPQKCVEVIFHKINGKDADIHRKIPGNISTVFSLAARQGNLEVMELLLKRGADPTITHGGRSPFICAAMSGNRACMRRVLMACIERSLTVDFNEQLDKTTALIEACYSGKSEVVHFLVEPPICASMCQRGCAHGPTPLIVAVVACDEEVIAKIIKHGGDPNATGGPVVLPEKNKVPKQYIAYVTPLLLAAALGRENIVNLLLHSGAMPDSLLDPGPLQTAVELNVAPAIVSALVAHNASLACLTRISHLHLTVEQYQPYHEWLTSLKSLQVRQCVNQPPAWIARFTSLQTLELLDAQSLCIGDDLGRLHSLTNLTLTSVAELPRTLFCRMHALQRLSLSGSANLLPLPPPNFREMQSVRLNVPRLSYWPSTWRGPLVPELPTRFSAKKTRKCYVNMRTLVELAASALSRWQLHRTRIPIEVQCMLECESNECANYHCPRRLFYGAAFTIFLRVSTPVFGQEQYRKLERVCCSERCFRRFVSRSECSEPRTTRVATGTLKTESGGSELVPRLKKTKVDGESTEGEEIIADDVVWQYHFLAPKQVIGRK